MIVGVAFPWTLERLLPSGSAFLSFEVGFVSDMIWKEAFRRKACECSELFIEVIMHFKMVFQFYSSRYFLFDSGGTGDT